MSHRTGLSTMLRPIGLALLLGAVLAGGCEKKPDPEYRIIRRTDFTPEEFGTGRLHTPNVACNREIDRLLDETRRCFNTAPEAQCNALQQENSDAIARLKGTARCRKPVR